MWNAGKDKPAPSSNLSSTPAAPHRPEPMKSGDSFRNTQDLAHIGKAVIIKGELSGNEDLYLDGEVEGSIDLVENSLTVGPHARIRANVVAKAVIVHGKIDGNITAADRVEMKRTAVVMGDISTHRIVIEDGAFFKGAVDVKKEPARQQQKSETPKAFAAAASIPAPSGYPKN